MLKLIRRMQYISPHLFFSLQKKVTETIDEAFSHQDRQHGKDRALLDGYFVRDACDDFFHLSFVLPRL